MGPLLEEGGSGSMGHGTIVRGGWVWVHGTMGPLSEEGGSGSMGPLSEEGGSGSVGPLLEEGEPTVRRGISLASELIFVLLWR